MLSGVLASFQTGIYTIRRRTPGTLTLGVWAAGTETSFTTGAVVQPLNGQALSLLPGGMHSENTRRIWTDTPLYSASADGTLPDIVVLGGEDYRVYQSQPWTGLGGDHFEAIITTWVAS